MAKEIAKKIALRLVQDKDNPNSFMWMRGKKLVATVIMLDNGLLEFSSDKHEIEIARIGCGEEIVVRTADQCVTIS